MSRQLSVVCNKVVYRIGGSFIFELVFCIYSARVYVVYSGKQYFLKNQTICKPKLIDEVENGWCLASVPTIFYMRFWKIYTLFSWYEDKWVGSLSNGKLLHLSMDTRVTSTSTVFEIGVRFSLMIRKYRRRPFVLQPLFLEALTCLVIPVRDVIRTTCLLEIIYVNGAVSLNTKGVRFCNLG